MTSHVKLAANGRICIPADIRVRLGLKDGDMLSIEETDDGIVLRSTEQAVRRAQAIFREMMKGKTEGAVDEFLRWKREEAARDEAHNRELHGD